MLFSITTVTCWLILSLLKNETLPLKGQILVHACTDVWWVRVD